MSKSTMQTICRRVPIGRWKKGCRFKHMAQMIYQAGFLALVVGSAITVVVLTSTNLNEPHDAMVALAHPTAPPLPPPVLRRNLNEVAEAMRQVARQENTWTGDEKREKSDVARS